MKRININTQQTKFIGCWKLENNKLCNERTNCLEKKKNITKTRRYCKWQKSKDKK